MQNKDENSEAWKEEAEAKVVVMGMVKATTLKGMITDERFLRNKE